MSKQLSAELLEKLHKEAQVFAKRRWPDPNNAHHLRFRKYEETAAINVAAPYALELTEAQERIKHLEDWLREISINCPGDARVMANEALTPNNQNKEDE